MKTIYFITLLIIWIIPSLSVQGQDNIGQTAFDGDSELPNRALTLRNKSSTKISVCVGWYDDEENCWMTRGFYKIDSGKSRTFNFVTTNSNLYYWAKSDDGVWEGKYSLSISKSHGFTIRLADSRFPSFAGEEAKLNYDDSSGMKKVQFELAKIAKGRKSATINLKD